ncbi:MAG: septum formation initiator family protein [Candidatus Neomarinimicrobiota bacterium]
MKPRRRRRKLRRDPPRKRHKSRSSLVPKLLLLVGVILVIIFFFGDHGIYRLYEMKREKKHVLKDIDRLREEQRELDQNKERLENDLEYIEKLARERHRMAKPGEKVFKVVEEPKK